MTFTIYPAIDLRGGKCVRLYQGDFRQETVYHDEPIEMARSFYEQGAEWLHLVDLDGARSGKPVNADIIKDISAAVPVKVEVGGGIRCIENVEDYLKAGVDRIILGSSAISDPEFVKEALRRFPEQVAIGIDARDGRVAAEGWLKTSDVSAVDLGKELAAAGAKTFIYTDISRDGALKGPNVEEIQSFAQATGQQVIASGGVSAISDVKELAANVSAGIAGAIIGKALYTNVLTLADALEVANHAG
ncbi:1-(5-phosphoribosyl)-5-[(5-phosphoribosylamino)methylideneamino] imidazole-4-carboxamide isomerase [Scopulibacillus darangshiensis]|uniref:1-(5-phosphoribosyl)-5-[(5-phosphoribosylamino)methylideneamino] imidazole-4-carboxamide isomerase n=1 Tax=Scopulibacillus darangshiensis TaxID=442528 RepID=A0A4V2SLV4_9BACL|nr:1-(5-phosphoribosyl)-5-[(5-phosphoribosylamino)methylideneamino]imidazole-4-carboxamide isomerase [Scopulibacillus darangshiensis]TCP24876.1 1-(5-phosphoribosyl)-5-[(5-phosphoribosylamino)methylideneamino] imidazole-4-carboxamide isomerase [Scopulibacillus darangshiensis]